MPDGAARLGGTATRPVQPSMSGRAMAITRRAAATMEGADPTAAAATLTPITPIGARLIPAAIVTPAPIGVIGVRVAAAAVGSAPAIGAAARRVIAVARPDIDGCTGRVAVPPGLAAPSGICRLRHQRDEGECQNTHRRRRDRKLLHSDVLLAEQRSNRRAPLGAADVNVHRAQQVSQA